MKKILRYFLVISLLVLFMQNAHAKSVAMLECDKLILELVGSGYFIKDRTEIPKQKAENISDKKDAELRPAIKKSQRLR